MTRMTGWDKVILALIIIGAINWGLIGFFRYDLVAAIFGGQLAAVSRIIFAVVGLAGLWALSLLFRDRRHYEVRDSFSPLTVSERSDAYVQATASGIGIRPFPYLFAKLLYHKRRGKSEDFTGSKCENAASSAQAQCALNVIRCGANASHLLFAFRNNG